MSTTTPTSVDVLIVGGGPTGMMLALELSAQQRGKGKAFSFRIVEKATSRSPYSRALAVHARTQELLNRHGDVRELIARSSTGLHGFSICVDNKLVATVPTSTMQVSGTQFDRPRPIPQYETEGWMEDQLAKRGCVVEMGVETTSIVQDGEGVTVKLRKAGGGDDGGEEEIVRAKYVVGADGAHSSVRHASGNMTFEGDAYPQEFLLADTHIRSSDPDRFPTNRLHMCLGWGMFFILPLGKDMVRLIISRPGMQQDQPHQKHGEVVEDEDKPKLEEFARFMREAFPGGGPGSELYDPVWLTRFRLHHRVVNTYRDGRLFVAGDAAHIHSPMGGQGMNTGIGDSANLGWKLAAVLRGERFESLLDTYDFERKPIGKRLLNSSDQMFKFVATTNAFMIYLRNFVLSWIVPWVLRLSGQDRLKENFRYISQLKIRYRRSPIVNTEPGLPEGGASGGDRAGDGRVKENNGADREIWLHDLLTPDCHHLLLFSGVKDGPETGSAESLGSAERRFLEQCLEKTAVKAHIITASNVERDLSGYPGYTDLDDNSLHKTFGFDNAGPGYVLVRPDGHIANIGPLSALDKAVNWV